MKAYVEILTKGRSYQWPKFRRKFLENNFCCKACCTYKNLEVHHIIPFSDNPKLELDETNCITLCKYCHLVFGHLRDYNLSNPEVKDDSKIFLKKRMEALRIRKESK